MEVGLFNQSESSSLCHGWKETKFNYSQMNDQVTVSSEKILRNFINSTHFVIGEKINVTFYASLWRTQSRGKKNARWFQVRSTRPTIRKVTIQIPCTFCTRFRCPVSEWNDFRWSLLTLRCDSSTWWKRCSSVFWNKYPVHITIYLLWLTIQFRLFYMNLSIKGVEMQVSWTNFLHFLCPSVIETVLPNSQQKFQTD